MTQHATKTELTRLWERKLTPGETLAIGRHLEICSECAAAAADAVDSRAAAESWGGTLDPTLGDHLRGDDLLDYVDGSLSPVAMSEAGAHLEHCTICRDDVADLHGLRGGGRRRWQRVALAAAAVLIVVIGIGVAVRRKPTSLPTKTVGRPPISTSTATLLADPPPAAWRALVDSAITSGRIAPPAILATLRMPAETVRGEGAGRASAVAPNGVVLDDPRPSFLWGGSPGAVYTVSVFDGDREAMRSVPLRSSAWTPERDLERGRMYRWQVEARRGNETSIIPPAPQPAPLFELLDDSAHRALDSARRRYPGDHLLLGVLAAHYGLQDEAIEELTRYQSAHPDSHSASLLDSVRAWSMGDQR
jgi:anti-sigma factor ChrR (cupin superfamily)